VTTQPDHHDILRRLDRLSAEVEHSDAEARQALEDDGLNADELVRAVREHVRDVLEPSRAAGRGWDIFRHCVLGLAAASAAVFVAAYTVNVRASLEAQHEAARTALISPLLPSLASEDPDRRSLALVIARQVDPAFASQAERQLDRWQVSADLRARVARNSVYANRILAGVGKLELSRDPDDRKAAIWRDLLPVLLDARKNRDEFVDVALEYQRVLPLLRLRNPDVFLDSYWGELWIVNILLESRIASVVDAARQQAPEPAVIEAIYQRNAPRLSERDRQAFEEAVTVYASTLKGLH